MLLFCLVLLDFFLPGTLCYWSYICWFSSPEENHFNMASTGHFYRYSFRIYSKSPALKYGITFLKKNCTKPGFLNQYFCIIMQTWMIGMLIKPQSFILYKHFFVFNKSTLCFKLHKPFFKYLVKKLEKHFAESSLSFSHIFFNAKFSNRLFYLGLVWKTHHVLFSSQFFHVIFQQQRFNYFLNKSLWFSWRDHGR